MKEAPPSLSRPELAALLRAVDQATTSIGLLERSGTLAAIERLRADLVRRTLLPIQKASIIAAVEPLTNQFSEIVANALAEWQQTLTSQLTALLPGIEVPHIWVPNLITLSSAVESALKRLEEAFAPGTFFGDVFIVAGRRPGHKGAAMDRLARAYFTKGALFHPARWRLLERPYQDYREVYGADPWHHLVVSALAMVCPSIADDQPLDGLYQWLRNEARKDIERALLDGETLDQRQGRQGRVVLWLPDTPEVVAKEAEVAAELAQMVDLRLEVQDILSKLSPGDRQIVESVAEGYTLVDLAATWQVTPGALRVRWHRLKQKIAAN